MKAISIIHIDDNQVFRDAFRFVVQSELSNVKGFRDGAEARADLGEFECDVLVVDSSGFQFARDMQGTSKIGATVILSGHPDQAACTADLKLSKTHDDWNLQIGRFLSDMIAERIAQGRGQSSSRRDIFGNMDERQREQYSGKILVMNAITSEIMFAADTLSGAEKFISESGGRNEYYRIAQGPSKAYVSLAALEC